ncbi:MAG: hypothetical protein AAF843_11395 [Bacteroidota bacterium]
MKRSFILFFITFILAGTSIQAQNLENIDQFTRQKLFDIRGSFSISTNYYFSSRDFNQQNPFRYVLSGNPILSIYGFDLPLSFTFANANFSATGPTNFQRMGLSPYYKWIKLHAGYRNLSFSPYTLNNHVFLGGGVELTPGKWRISAMYGRFNEAIEEDSTRQTLPPSYRRTGYAIKVGYGTNESFVEMSVLKAKDDARSIAEPVNADISPSENLAIGLSTRQTFFKKLVWEFHAGASAYTEDISAGEIESEEVDIPDFFTNLFEPRVSSRVNFAGHTSLTYRARKYSIKAEYMRVDPEYETMGSYFFNNDLERYTLTPSFSLLQGKINVNASLGLQRDNLLNNKAATTNRTIGSANLQIAPTPQLSINAQYSNYATQQESGLVNLNDTIRIFQVNHNINVTPAYIISNDQLYHSFVLALGSQILVDRNIFTSEFSESTTNNANFNYRFKNSRVQYGLSAGLNYLTLESAQSDITRYGLSLGAEKALFDKKMTIQLNGMYNLSQLNGSSDGSVINGNLDVRYTPHPAHNFSIRSQAILNRTTVGFDDYIVSANYSFMLL